MLKRVRQFVRAVTAKIRPQDIVYVRRHLSAAGQELFWRMALYDQRHALNVAYTAEKLAREKNFSSAELNFLLRCALLHDVGKQHGDMGISGKIAAVLADKVAPRTAQKFARAEGNFTCSILRRWRRILRVYYEHPTIGAAKLVAVNLTAEAAVIRRHHAPATPVDSPTLTLLRQADEFN